MKKITIIGLGYIGLPLAILATAKGHNVVGFDIDKERLKQIKNKNIKIEDSEANELFKKNDLNVSDNLKSSDIYIICVPTPVNTSKLPDLEAVICAVKSISKVLKDGELIVIESTIYPGLSEETLVPILDKTNKKYFFAHCPERVNPGDNKWNIFNIPRVIGGINLKSTKLAAEFYNSILNEKVKELSTIRNAEATKILENIFRDVNIALVNEMSQSFYRMNIDVKEVIDAAATKPFSFMAHYPGIGVGGHCIAIDPYYMIEKGKAAGFDHELLTIARKINNYMPIYATNLLQNTFNDLGLPIKGRTIGVYGLTYKPNVGDIRESPSFEIIKRLKKLKGANVIVFDPFVPKLSDVKTLREFLINLEAIVICTAHDEIKNIDYDLFKNKSLKVIIDGRNCLDKKKIKGNNLIYKGIGRN